MIVKRCGRVVALTLFPLVALSQCTFATAAENRPLRNCSDVENAIAAVENRMALYERQVDAEKRKAGSDERIYFQDTIAYLPNEDDPVSTALAATLCTIRGDVEVLVVDFGRMPCSELKNMVQEAAKRIDAVRRQVVALERSLETARQELSSLERLRIEACAEGEGVQSPPPANTPDLVGTWTGTSGDGKFTETWTIDHADGAWSVIGEFFSGGQRVGAFNGRIQEYANGTLRFQQVFSLRPDDSWAKVNNVVASAQGDVLTFTWDTGRDQGEVTLARKR